MAHQSPSVSIEERRKFPRRELPPRFDVSLLRPQGAVPAQSINVSEGGLCVRLEEMVEVRSLVRLQVTPVEGSGSGRGQRPMECAGRVAWVIQRLDLRSAPPFLFDVGVEFVDPPPLLRPWMAQRAGGVSALKARSSPQRGLEPSVIRARQFIPRLERDSNHPPRWHLVVSVDGAPCFSGRYPGERAALEAWEQFKRREAKR